MADADGGRGERGKREGDLKTWALGSFMDALAFEGPTSTECEAISSPRIWRRRTMKPAMVVEGVSWGALVETRPGRKATLSDIVDRGKRERER